MSNARQPSRENEGEEQPASEDERIWEPGMSGALVTSTVLFALSHGLEAATIEDLTGTPILELSDPDARYAEDVVPRVWRALNALHPERTLTLRMAEAAPPSFFGPLAYGAQFAPDLRHAIEVFIRYRGLLSSTLVTQLRDEETSCVLEVAHPFDELDAGAGAEVGLAMGRRFIAEVLGLDDCLVLVEFNHRCPASPAPYERFFGAPVDFGAPRTALHFSRESFAQPPARPDPQLYAYIKSHLRTAADKITCDDSLAEVRHAIASNVARHEYGAEALANTVGVSLRVLQRRVSATGTTVRKLLEQARCAQAKQLLGDRRLSVDEVAFVLSYSDERAFRRAFKRMTGASPAQFRRTAGQH